MDQTTDATALSARQAEVAALYVDGLSYKEIARSLDISPGTVRTHLNAIFQKLDVSSRTELGRRLAPPAAAPAKVATEPAPPAEPRGPESRQLTFLFADIVGSTEMAVRLDAEDMHGVLARFRATVRAALSRHGGHAAGFPGDGAVAVFGWPEAGEDATRRAASAALAIAAETPKITTPEGESIKVRVGVATGLAVVEGTEGRAEDFVGSAANLAARLQGAAEPGAVLISDLTRTLIGQGFEAEPLPPVVLRGFHDPVPAHRLLRERAHLTRFEVHDLGSRRTPLLGRDDEIARLEKLWREARDGAGGAVVLEGPAGIGKSRLAETLAGIAIDGGARLIRLQTAENRSASPLWPVRQAISAEAALDPDAAVDERRAVLDAWLEEAPGVSPLGRMLMANMLDLAGEDELPAMSASRRRNLVLDTVADALLAMSRERPLLLLFEDTHWIDPTSLDLVARLLRAGPREALLLVMTTRPEGAPDLPEAELSERLVLQPLPPETAERLVRERAGAAAIDDATVTTIVARTDGVPLYVEETTAAVLDGVGGGDAVPATLRESLTARLDRLGPAREVAQIAAAIGRDVDLDLLAVVSAGTSVSADADRLVEAGLASPRRGGFVFSHALVQDAAYQSMLRSRRRDLHGRIAEAMLGRFRRRFASEPETLAHHLERAGRTAAAIDYFLRAADAAGARAANREAEGYAQRALALTDLLDGGAERDRREVAALLALGRIRTAIFGYGRNEAAEPLRRALDRCQAAGMHRTEFPLVVALTAQAGVSGDGAKALQMSRRAADLAADSDDPAHKVMAAYAVGVTHCWRGERRNASDAFAAGAALWREALHERLLELGPQDSGIVCMTRGAMNRFHVYVDPAESERIDEAIELARRLGHAHSLNYGLHFKAVQAIEAANWERAETTIREMLDLAEEQGFGTWRSQGRLQVARFAAARLSPRSALKEAEHAVKALPEGGNHASLPQAKGLVGDALRRLGRTAEALTLLQQAVAEAEAGAMGWGLIETLCALARCLLATDGGDATRAEATLARAVALARRQGSRLWELRTACELAEVLLHQGDRSAARESLAATVAAVDGAALPADLARARDLLRAVA